MLPDAARLAAQAISLPLRRFVRCTLLDHRETPLGMGFGKTRFASPDDRFKLLYLGQDLATAVAETIVRDRFEGQPRRQLHISDITAWGALEASTTAPLQLLNLRGDACFRLGVSTDIVGAKAQDLSRQFSKHVYANSAIDGLLYESRLLKRPCVAVYDRAVPRLTASPVMPVEHLADLVPALQQLQISLIR